MSSWQIPIGIPWYRREDYDRLKDIFEDGAEFQVSYEDWLNASEDAATALSRRQYKVERVTIDPDAFCDWCRKNGRKMDALARTAFANAVVDQKYGLGF